MFFCRKGALFGLGALAAGRIADPAPSIASVGGELYVTVGSSIGLPKFIVWDGNGLRGTDATRAFGAAPSNSRSLVPSCCSQPMMVARDASCGQWDKPCGGAYRIDAVAGTVVNTLNFGAIDIVVATPATNATEGTVRNSPQKSLRLPVQTKRVTDLSCCGKMMRRDNLRSTTLGPGRTSSARTVLASTVCLFLKPSILADDGTTGPHNCRFHRCWRR